MIIFLSKRSGIPGMEWLSEEVRRRLTCAQTLGETQAALLHGTDGRRRHQPCGAGRYALQN
jgi:hypothetical protein